jgi:cytochrome bd-type quinol oxidase subunit 2
VNSRVATETHTQPRARRSARALLVLSMGPLAVLAGIVWARLQPYRLTILDPHGQGFWWLLSEPPLWVIAVGLVFHAAVAPGVVEDLEEAEGP